MQRLLAAAVAAGTLLLLGGCGGGAKITPNPQSGGDENHPLLEVAIPNQIIGSHTGSIVPNQLSVRSTATDDELTDTLGKFGYSIISRNGDFATVSIPGGNLDAAITLLEKEFNIFSADKINLLNTARYRYSDIRGKAASTRPFAPEYGDFFDAFGGSTDPAAPLSRFPSQGIAMDTMGFPGAWDISTNPTVSAVPVKVAVIDAGFLDYSIDQPRIDETLIDAANSGSVDGTGAFTAGFAAATWDQAEVDSGGQFILLPLRDVGQTIFSMLACLQNFPVQVWAFDIAQDGITEDEVWNEGIAGMNPSAQYVLIKTGTPVAGAWTFSDNEIAESIDHAVAAGSNIIVLGMFSTAPVGPNVSASIAAARAADCLVIAPAGDVVSAYDGANGFTTPPVDIATTSISPASDPNCVSVAATGMGGAPPLGTVDFGAGPINNLGNGWSPRVTPTIFGTWWADVAPYSNYNATIAANGFGIGMTLSEFIATGGSGVAGDPFILPTASAYGFNLGRFSTAHAAAYVAGAASMVYQALAVSNGGTFPADVDTVALNTLLGTGDFAPLARLDDTFTEVPDALAGGAGYLNANKAMSQAISGGSLFTDPLAFTPFIFSQPLTAVTVNQDFSMTANVLNGVGPYDLTVDWGDGNGPQVFNNWVPGTIVTLTGGYQTLGPKAITVTVTDSKGQTVQAGGQAFVINPLTASIIVTDQSGTQVALNSLMLATNYVFEVRANNVYTGTYDDDDNPATPEVPNTTTFNWDFDGNGTTDATGTSPSFAYPTPGTKTIILTVQEDFRPDQVFNIQVTVS